jgi:penicillin-binding protein 1C
MRVPRRSIIAGLVAAVFTASIAAYAGICWSRAKLDAMPASFMLLDRHGELLAQIGGSDAAGYGYWPAPKESDRLVQALLALEDRRFWSHPGVDPVAVARAAWQDLTSGRRLSGASSIAMQVARLQHPEPRTLLNKAIEAGTALALTLRYGRATVLEQYLRIVPVGNNGHGVAYAARLYFDKPAADLSWAEIALLAAIPQAPGRMNPMTAEGRARAVARGERVLAYLAAVGVIPERDFAMAREQLAAIEVRPLPRRPPIALHTILRLEHLLGGADAWLERHQEARIAATLDLDLQGRVERLASQHLAEWRAADAEQVAVAVVDRRSGEVLAWVGSAGYFGGDAGAIDYGATDRSPGSTLKPFLYALALDRGLIRADVPLRDEPDVAPGIENADRRYLGRLLPRQALANSRNAPAAALVRELGVEDAYAYLRGLGLSDGDETARHYGLGLAVGALPTSLERVVRAYGALANDGMLSDLVWYRGQDRSPPVRVMSPTAARLVTLFLADPMARLPSFSRMGPAEFPYPVAVKTGTSQDYRDAWTFAYSTDFVVGVWVGRADVGPMRGLGGITSAAELAHAVMADVERDRGPAKSDLSFPAPEAYRGVEVCASGEPAVCPAVFHEWVPDHDADKAANILIDRRTGALALQSTPREDVFELRVPVPAPLDPMLLRPSRASEDAVRIDIVSPEDGAHFLIDPDAPAESNTVALRARIRGPFKSVTWYVDDERAGSIEGERPLHLRLRPGIHRLQARIAGRPESAAVVTIKVE